MVALPGHVRELRNRLQGLARVQVLDACADCRRYPSLLGGTLLLTYLGLDCPNAPDESRRCLEVSRELEAWADSGTIGVPALEQEIIAAVDESRVGDE